MKPEHLRRLIVSAVFLLAWSAGPAALADDAKLPSVGACCTPGLCQALDQTGCESAGGSWLGPGVICGQCQLSTPPTLAEIQAAITNQGKSWTAANHAIWQLSWSKFRDMQGAILPYDSLYADHGWITPSLPASFDWRNNGGVSYVSPVKNQGWCGSCWAFAAVGTLESLLMIRGYSPCGAENLSEEFVVACNNLNFGCFGGNPWATAHFMVNNSGLHFGAPDELCFPYTSGATHVAPPCANACNTWLARDRSIDSFKFIRSSKYYSQAAGAGAIDSMKSAIYAAPVWAAFTVMDDFKAYSSGVYEYTTGDVCGGHAIIIVGWDDNNQCFICKNSWDTTWGENGFFRIGYSQLAPPVNFGAYTVSYDKAAADAASCWRYDKNIGTGLDWVPATQLQPITANDQVLDVDLGMSFKFFCHFTNRISISSNGWMSTEPGQTEPCPAWFPIPSTEGPPAMIAPLWTDLDPSVSWPDKGIFTRNMGDGRFVIEFRNIARRSQPSVRETFETILYDPAIYPTTTGEGRIRFQYLQHDPAQTFQTVGIEDHQETCGIEIWNDGTWPGAKAVGDGTAAHGAQGDGVPKSGGTPIQPGMVIDFTPHANGDEFPPLPPTGLAAVYAEPVVVLSWTNPTNNTNNFPLSYLDTALISRDGAALAEIPATPGEAGLYEDRWASAGAHAYTVMVRAGNNWSTAAGAGASVPGLLHYSTHASNNVSFTVTDQGSCGFLDADQVHGTGFRYGTGGANCLYSGSFCLGTGPYTCVNRDYPTDKYRDWQPVQSFGTLKKDGAEEFTASYDDAAHPNPQGLLVVQRSRAWSQAPLNDLVMLSYTIINPGSTTIGNIYAGQFMDWDVPSTYPYNQGRTNAGLRLAYMWQGAGQPYVGVALLSHTPANLTMIHNPTYVWPDSALSDLDRFYFLSAADAAHSVSQSWETTDWSTMVSAGPFSLAPQDSVVVTFAVLGGTTEADLLAHAAVAQAWYASPASVDQGRREEAGRTQLLPGTPNPFQDGTLIRYTVKAKSPVDLRIFDPAGRVVRQLVRAEQSAGVHEIRWDGRDDDGRLVPAGVYFCRVRSDGGSDARKLVLLRDSPIR